MSDKPQTEIFGNPEFLRDIGCGELPGEIAFAIIYYRDPRL